ncbi:RICIN domain-containing protein, partial [Hymenobacter sp. AT01-02]
VVQQWTDNGNDAQRWQIVSLGDGYVKLVHKGTNQCLDVDNNLSNPGTGVHQYTDNGNDAQRWRLDLMPVPLNSGRTTLAMRDEAPAGALAAFPNPARTTLTLTFVPRHSETVSLDVYSSTGQLVWHRTLSATAGVAATTSFSTEALPAGFYTTRLTSKSSVQRCAIVVTH